MLEILDTTLREGEQTPYVNFTIDEKIEIARMLDPVGVEMIEAGDPSVSSNVAGAAPTARRMDYVWGKKSKKQISLFA